MQVIRSCDVTLCSEVAAGKCRVGMIRLALGLWPAPQWGGVHSRRHANDRAAYPSNYISCRMEERHNWPCITASYSYMRQEWVPNPLLVIADYRRSSLWVDVPGRKDRRYHQHGIPCQSTCIEISMKKNVIFHCSTESFYLCSYISSYQAKQCDETFSLPAMHRNFQSIIATLMWSILTPCQVPSLMQVKEQGNLVRPPLVSIWRKPVRP